MRELPEFSVSQFVAVFNQSVEMLYPEVMIVGEVSNFRISKNKWVYFDLKDAESSLKMFGTVYMLPGPLEDGLEVQVVGRPRLHNNFGFSISMTSVKPVGEGSIKKASDMLFKRLDKEGLFDPERKRELPYPPETIALISSKESAGYGDFMKIIKSRWPNLRVKTYDVQVQGVDAPDQIITALSTANQTDAEVIVIIRGGGSKDDLVAFDHERLVRAVAGSRIPTLIAIGHERDESLAELASDSRASTPSNAGEILVPDFRRELELLEQKMYTITDLHARIFQAKKDEIEQNNELIQRLFTEVITREKHDITIKQQLLQSLDPRTILRQGYGIVRKSGERLSSVAGLKKGDNLEIILADGTVNSIVEKV